MEYFRVKLLRRFYLIFCIFLGILAPIYCWYLRPGFNPMERPLSDFGIQEPTWLFWNSSLVLLAMGVFLNAYTALRYYFKQKIFRYPLKGLLIISSFSLFFTATIPMNYELLHKIPAFLFFFSYNLFVFLFGLFRSFKYLRKGIFSVIIGLLMLFSLLLLLPFNSYGVFEIVYFTLILIWNIYFLYTRIREEGIRVKRKDS
ncbi:DUF998 domain-containing protein [Flavobacteriales bacterium]|nr:DUF998 domain-containing protein [Flavobacteriales bacterium]